MINPIRIVGQWYWTSKDKKDWWPMQYIEEDKLVWSNQDTDYIYEDDNEIQFWIHIPYPKEG